MTNMGAISRSLRWMSFAAGVGLLFSSEASADPRVALSGHVVPQLRHATKVGRTPADETVHMSFVLKVDAELLQQTLDGLYGPGAALKRHFLSSSEFAQRFDLASKRATLKTFVEASGFTVDTANGSDSSLIMKVSASSQRVEQVLGIQLNQYQTTDGQIFRAHETEPMVPASLAPHLTAILGLSTLSGMRHPHRRTASPLVTRSPRFPGSGTSGSLTPSDIKTIYQIDDATLTGAGQTVAAFELDGYRPSDIASYQSMFSLPSLVPTFLGVDGMTNLCGSHQNHSCATESPTADTGMQEVALDIEMIVALAPSLSQLLVYDAPNTDAGAIDEYNKIATDDLAQAVTTSWGLDEQDEGSSDADTENLIFQRMATQGQTLYAAAGDQGAYDMGGRTTLSVDDPASQPFVTGVGGTTLSGTLQSPSETVWNDGFSSSNNAYEAAGGGVSMLWTLPTYQVGLAGAASQQFRNVPDVVLNADPNTGYTIIVGNTFFEEGGTSAAAPLWAGLTALINQKRIAKNLGYFGFANPSLYPLAAGGSYQTYFNDVTVGTNGFYSAATGYDNASGLGSFKGDALIGTVATITPPSITRQPVSETVDLSQTATFSVQAAGPNLVYQWQKEVLGTTSFTAIPGATNSKYITAPLTAADDQTQFDCVVTNGGGMVTSESATLTVVAATTTSRIVIYPNPWDSRSDSGAPMRFTGIPDGSIITLYTISARKIKTLSVRGGAAAWDMSNDSGQSVASGYYLYVIAPPNGSSVTGKIAVLR